MTDRDLQYVLDLIDEVKERQDSEERHANVSGANPV
jgi:hypothetical protein